MTTVVTLATVGFIGVTAELGYRNESDENVAANSSPMDYVELLAPSLLRVSSDEAAQLSSSSGYPPARTSESESVGSKAISSDDIPLASFAVLAISFLGSVLVAIGIVFRDVYSQRLEPTD